MKCLEVDVIKTFLFNLLTTKSTYFLNRYHELLFIVDTCQAESMGKLFYSPNVVAIGSSAIGEESLSVSSS